MIAAIAISESAGIIGGLFTASAIPTWYRQLIRPPLSPPNWVFGPVWTVLYLFMGIAAFLVWKKAGKQKPAHAALGIFALQLLLNMLWSIVFFGLRNPFLAFVEILILIAAIVWTMIRFYRFSHAATYLLAPYLAWVIFAAYLNFGIWMLN